MMEQGMLRSMNVSAAETPGVGPALERTGVDRVFAQQLTAIANVVQRFALISLMPAVRACKRLSGEGAIDLAVLGQFKSGKSSLLNAVLGEALLPVGALPVTAVVTRLVAGTKSIVRVTDVDGRVEEVAPERLAEFVTEAGNPGNRRQVYVVDVLTPAMRDLSAVRLVDTPGLGSAFVHNTEATRAWMPNVAAALVTISAERPLSDEDLRLMDEARQTAPRVVVVLTKVDLVTDVERTEIVEFLKRGLHERFRAEIPVLPFSTRIGTQRWLSQLRENLLLPVVRNVVGERRAALALKLNGVAQSCRDYLSVGIQAAERTETDRNRLRAAVFNEQVSMAVIQDELVLAEQGIRAATRPAFEKHFLSHQSDLRRRVSDALVDELATWQGNLAAQARCYEAWMERRLVAELTPLSADAAVVANVLVERAEERLRRIVEAFRDRLNRNVHHATGVTVSSPAWEARRPTLSAVPVNVGQTFMVHWDLLWWLLPMSVVGGLFRRQVIRQVSWEVEKNLTRLASDWTKALDKTLADLRMQATTWVETELNTLGQLLEKQPTESTAFREALREIDGMVEPPSSE
jgi:GTP-binding protein EngB required for normal cell division